MKEIKTHRKYMRTTFSSIHNDIEITEKLNKVLHL